jgi:pyruvate, orthophosphate dikinase
VAQETMKRYNVKLSYLVGTMIELPRAAVTADRIATEAEFFSFGTNDLTQTTFGFSRDDAAKFIDYYKVMNLMDADPFAVLDREGVGSLMKTAIAGGRKTRPGIKLGICGEHGGDASSVEFCHQLGLDYVSCSPFRVPIARLAAAQAALSATETPRPAKKAAPKRTSRPTVKETLSARRSKASKPAKASKSRSRRTKR